jgi:hypothetical protein
MDWPALLEALRPYGFRTSPVMTFDAYRTKDHVRVMWWPSQQKVTVMQSICAEDIGKPPLFSGSPEEVVRYFEQGEGKKA